MNYPRLNALWDYAENCHYYFGGLRRFCQEHYSFVQKNCIQNFCRLDLAVECAGNKSRILYTVFEMLSIFYYAEVCSADSDCTSATNGANKVCTSGICVCGSDYVLGDDGVCVQSKIRSKYCVCVCLCVCV